MEEEKEETPSASQFTPRDSMKDSQGANCSPPPENNNNKINQSQFYDLITGEESSWQAIIYDLVKTEQLDPWDIQIGILADKYVIIIEQMEEANFFVSSKVLLACALLLRLKSEVLLNRDIPDLNEILYGKKEEKVHEYERIEIDEDELPILVPKTPMPRNKKVTLDELMSALNQAIETENRRIRKDIKTRQAEKSALVVMPKINRIKLRDRVKDIFIRIKAHLSKPEIIQMNFSHLAPTKEEKLSSFLPILHLANQERIYLNQEEHYGEIYMMLEKLQDELTELAEEVVEVENSQDNIDIQ